MSTPSFRRGAEEAAEAAKSSGANFSRAQFLSIEDNKQVVLRYVLESRDWLIVDQHFSIPTKNKPAGYEGSWPEKMPATCRHDRAFASMYTDCFICDDEQMKALKDKWNKPINRKAPRVWSIACLREEVVGTPEMVGQIINGKEFTADQIGTRLGYKDATREVAEVDAEGKPTGNTRQERALVLVNFGHKNYFGGLEATGAIYGTVCDRDYIVKRVGTDTDTVYNHIPLDFSENLHPAFKRDGRDYPETDSWARYAQAVEEQGLDLVKIVSDRASDEYYARFFDPSKSAPASGTPSTSGSASAAAPEAPAAPVSDVDEDRLKAMRERVRQASSPALAEVD